MGQYFVAMSKDREEYTHSWSLGGGSKLWEWIWNRHAGVLPYLLVGKSVIGDSSPNQMLGRWARSHVALVGDYDESDLWYSTYTLPEVERREARADYPWTRPADWKPFVNIAFALQREYNLAIGRPHNEPLVEYDWKDGKYVESPLKNSPGGLKVRFLKSLDNLRKRDLGTLFLLNHTRQEMLCPYCLGIGGTLREWCRCGKAGIAVYLLRRSSGLGGGDVENPDLPYVGRWAFDDVELAHENQMYNNISVPLAREYNAGVEDPEYEMNAYPCIRCR